MQGKLVVIKAGGEITVETLDKAIQLETLKRGIGGGYIELIPGFATLRHEDKYHDCYAFCDEEGKLNGLPYNRVATHMWDEALVRQGHSLRNEKGEYNDILVGDIAIVIGDKQLLETV